MKYRKNDKSGIILIITIWILVILTILAMSIARMARLELALTGFYLDKMKASYVAEAGFSSVLARIQEDSNNPETRDYDTLYECGISIAQEITAQDIFKDVSVGEGTYSVGYNLPVDEEETYYIFGLQDEERKLNINAININNFTIFSSFLESFDVDSETAEIIAASISDWRDADSNVTDSLYGAEDDYYMREDNPYHCKNSYFESLEEILLVREMTEEIFLKIKDYITVYPFESSSIRVNVNTDDRKILNSLSSSTVDKVPGTDLVDADSLTEKIVLYRLGDDGIEATDDDRLISLQQPGDLLLNPKENALFARLRNDYLVAKSDYFRINVEGYSEDGKIVSKIQTVVNRDELAPIAWQEN